MLKARRVLVANELTSSRNVATKPIQTARDFAGPDRPGLQRTAFTLLAKAGLNVTSSAAISSSLTAHTPALFRNRCGERAIAEVVIEAEGDAKSFDEFDRDAAAFLVAQPLAFPEAQLPTIAEAPVQNWSEHGDLLIRIACGVTPEATFELDVTRSIHRFRYNIHASRTELSVQTFGPFKDRDGTQPSRKDAYFILTPSNSSDEAQFFADLADTLEHLDAMTGKWSWAYAIRCRLHPEDSHAEVTLKPLS